MMKKLTIVLLSVLLYGFSAFSQKTIILSESFDEGNMQSWTADKTNWFVDPTSGGAEGENISEAVVAYLGAGSTVPGTQADFVGGSLMRSQWVSSKNIENLYVTYKYFYINSNAGIGQKEFGVALRNSSKDDWSYFIIDSAVMHMSAAKFVSYRLPDEFCGKDSLQFAMLVKSKRLESQAYMYMFDDIRLFGVQGKAADLMLENSDFAYPTQSSITVKGTISNQGPEVSKAVLHYTLGGGEVVTTSITKKIRVGESIAFQFPFKQWSPEVGKTYELKVWVNELDGAAPAGNTVMDTIIKNISVADPTKGEARRLLIESFTSSTCGPCAGFNTSVINPFMTQYQDQYTMIKYQQDFPGSGDPYATTENIIRRGFYAVNSVPSLIADGVKLSINSTSTSSLGRLAEEAANSKSFFKIEYIKNEINGNGIYNGQIKLTSLLSGTASVYVNVLEGMTVKNVGTNGEKSFKNVNLAHLTGAAGKEYTFVANEALLIDLSYDMTETHMEEMSDLYTTVFIQHNPSKVVYQSSIEKVKGKADAINGKIADWTIPAIQASTDKVPLRGVFHNLGLTATSIEYMYSVDGVQGTAKTLDNLETEWYEKYYFDEGYISTTEGEHTLKMWITKINGEAYTDRDTAEKKINVSNATYAYVPLVEEFTSSTCVPCKDINEQVINPVYAAQSGKMSLIKYPMNLPASGDPYFKDEFASRRENLSLSGSLPEFMLSGIPYELGEDMAAAKTSFESKIQSRNQEKSIASITADTLYYVAKGPRNVVLDLKINSSQDATLRLFAVVVEKETLNNDKTNGETSFINTAIKFIPNVLGAQVTLKAGQTYNYVNKASLSNTSVEDPMDLVLVCFLCDEDAYVIQSVELPISGFVSAEENAAAESIRMYPNPAKELVYINIPESADLEIFDLTGRRVYAAYNVNGKHEVSTAAFAGGQYIVKLSNSQYNKTAKLSVIK